MATLDDIGGIGSLFGLNPTTLNAQREQQYMDFASKVANAEAVRPGTGSVLGANVMGARGVQQLGSMFGIESPEDKLAKLRQAALQQFDSQTPQGLTQAAQFLNQQGDAAGAQQAILAAQNLEKTSLGLQKTRAEVSKAELTAANEEKLRAELSTLGPNPSDQAVIAVVQKYGSPDKILQILTQSQDRAAARAVAASNRAASQGPLGPLSTAEKVVDQKFGKEYNDFINGGGINTVEKNLKLLDDAIKIIKDSSEGDISGKMVGLADKAGTLSYTHPKAAEAKDLIGGVAQSNLRQVLGGQFAAKEGEQLLARAYNPAQPKRDNLNRLTALREQIANTGTAKANAALYYQDYGTLKGFKGIGAGGSASPAETPTEKKKTTRKLKSGIEVTVEE